MPLPTMTTRRSAPQAIAAWLRILPAAAVLVPALLLANVVQMASVVVWPFSRRLFRLINTSLAAWWWSGCVLAARHLHGVRVEVSGDVPPADENAVVLVNHQSMSDIPVLLDVAYGYGRLTDLKWYVKDILKYVPGIGWGMLFLDCLFIKRNWTRDRHLIERVFASIIRGKVPVWIVSFLEGTRSTPRKVEESRAYAQKAGLPPLDHVLIPRTKGFVATLAGLKGYIDAVYDVTIGYVDAIPNLGQWFLGCAPLVRVHLERFPLSDLPEDEAEQTAWAMARYEAKDRRLGRYYETGTISD